MIFIPAIGVYTYFFTQIRTNVHWREYDGIYGNFPVDNVGTIFYIPSKVLLIFRSKENQVNILMHLRKSIALLLLALPVIGFSQTYLLLDRKWVKQAILSDSVPIEKINKGYYPIYAQELDSLVRLVGQFRNLRDEGLKRKFFNSDQFKTDHLIFEIENIRRTYGDGYEINIISTVSSGTYKLKISDPRLLLLENQKVVRAFLKYLESTQKKLVSATKVE